MRDLIRVGIIGYGNLGRGVHQALAHAPDMELQAIFTRRNPENTRTGATTLHVSALPGYIGKIDVMFLCGGSATDLPEQGPAYAAMFNTVDSFDTHPKIQHYFRQVEQAAQTNGHLSLISTGWDPGLFSLSRVLAESVLPNGREYTFWGHGVSQGHSDAIRRIDGVKNAIQYTIPVAAAVENVRSGDNPSLSTREKHTRLCYVVADDGADTGRIERQIKQMPDYFRDYDTTVHFISQEELAREHSGMPHGGFVIRTGKTGQETRQRVEFSLELGSNPEFTGSVMAAYGRAVYRMATEGRTGACTVFDIPIGYLSLKSAEQLRQEML